MPVIYTASALSLAMLERLVQETTFENTLLVEASVPDDLAVEDVFATPPANWNGMDVAATQDVGQRWIIKGRSALLRVPSVVVRRECNYLVNPSHPAARTIRPSNPVPLIWDTRLFNQRPLRQA